jgi:hypothetical protein
MIRLMTDSHLILILRMIKLDPFQDLRHLPLQQLRSLQLRS